MEKHQEQEWAETQNLAVTVDLVAAAKQQLRFLAEVDRNRHLHDGPGLDRAILRYKYCWLPLLANQTEDQLLEGESLVVPLDCEWIWHCHRLNPIRYKTDCEELYGRILDNRDVISSIQRTCSNQTEEKWRSIYPDEPYEFNTSSQFQYLEKAENAAEAPKSTKYDLVSAVRRQIPFFYQVSRSYMNEDIFVEEAVARYKGFLHLIKRNWEKSVRRFCVPTYDIDLIWHSHQLSPVSYCKDLVAALGKVLEHDDTDTDRSKGKKLDNGFSTTTEQWEETFGSRYWRAGAMYRGNTPSPLPIDSGQLDTLSKIIPSNVCETTIQLQRKMMVEIMVEIVGIRDLPHGHKGSLFVTVHKERDTFFNDKRRLSIFSETKQKRVIVFQCESAGELVFELMSCTTSALAITKPAKSLGTTTISLKDLFNPVSRLSMEKWFDLRSNSGVADCKSISMRIAFSFTPPVQAPYLLRMVQRGPLSNSCFFPLPGRLLYFKSSHILDETDNEIITLKMRDSLNMKSEKDCVAKKEVIGATPSGRTLVLAESAGTGWLLMNSNWSLQVRKLSEEDYAFELQGSRKVIVFPGRRLEYEVHSKKRTEKQDFVTAVEFSTVSPCGKAVALLDLKYGFMKIDDESLVLPMTILAFILSNCSSKKLYHSLT